MPLQLSRYMYCSTYNTYWNRVKPSFSLPPPFRREMPRRLLDHVAERKQGLLVERAADQLQPEREAVAVEACRNRDPGQAGHVRSDGEHVVQIHLHRIA